LPEPLLTAPDVAEDVVLADSVSMAMLLVLETLTPTERAVFVLRDVFDVGYDEIAEAVDKTPAAVRQTAHRARAHVAAHRPREVVSPAETRGALEAFRRAAENGRSARPARPPRTRCRLPRRWWRSRAGRAVARAGSREGGRRAGRRAGQDHAASLQQAQINGSPALVLRLDGKVDTVVAVRIDDGLITGLYAVRNPAKLSPGAGDRTTPVSPGPNRHRSPLDRRGVRGRCFGSQSRRAKGRS
jgi:RNA polymerase sigma-70 factor (ECF subfamily)